MKDEESGNIIEWRKDEKLNEVRARKIVKKSGEVCIHK